LTDHAKEELGHADGVGLRIIGLGGYPLPAIERPTPLKKVEDILKELLYREQEGMALYRKVHGFCGENEGTRQLIEGNIGIEQEHIDDLWRMLNSPEEITKAEMSAGRTTQPPESKKKQEYDDSFARFTEGVTGSTTPDLPDRGRDWHGTVPGVKDEDQGEDEDQDKAEAYLSRPPKDVLATKSHPTDEAIKALAGVSHVFPGPFTPPRERDFMLQNGYTPEEIECGATMTPRLRAEFNRFVANSVRKSLSSIKGER
jgi:hypothetical protein